MDASDRETPTGGRQIEESCGVGRRGERGRERMRVRRKKRVEKRRGIAEGGDVKGKIYIYIRENEKKE